MNVACRNHHQQQHLGSGLKRHGSVHSLSSNTFSNSSRPGASRAGKNPRCLLQLGFFLSGVKGRGLTEKLAEMETFRDILCRQVDTLGAYFEACSDLASVSLDPTAGGDGGENEGARPEADGMMNVHPTLTKDILRQVRGSPRSQEELAISSALLPFVQHGLHSVDFKGEAITFKATTAGILTTLNHCLDLMAQREESWRRKVEREQAARRAAEERCRSAVGGSVLRARSSRRFAWNGSPFQVEFAQGAGGVESSSLTLPKLQPPKVHPHKTAPDYEEGPHSQLGREGAVWERYGLNARIYFLSSSPESRRGRVLRRGGGRLGQAGGGADVDRPAEEDGRPHGQAEGQGARRQCRRRRRRGGGRGVEGGGGHHQAPPLGSNRQGQSFSVTSRPSTNLDSMRLLQTTNEQLHYARLLPGGKDGVWELFAEDGEMKMFKREEEVDGMVVDPLKALHQVKGERGGENSYRPTSVCRKPFFQHLVLFRFRGDCQGVVPPFFLPRRQDGVGDHSGQGEGERELTCCVAARCGLPN